MSIKTDILQQKGEKVKQANPIRVSYKFSTTDMLLEAFIRLSPIIPLILTSAYLPGVINYTLLLFVISFGMFILIIMIAFNFFTIARLHIGSNNIIIEHVLRDKRIEIPWKKIKSIQFLTHDIEVVAQFDVKFNLLTNVAGSNEHIISFSLYLTLPKVRLKKFYDQAKLHGYEDKFDMGGLPDKYKKFLTNS